MLSFGKLLQYCIVVDREHLIETFICFFVVQFQAGMPSMFLGYTGKWKYPFINPTVRLGRVHIILPNPPTQKPQEIGIV